MPVWIATLWISIAMAATAGGGAGRAALAAAAAQQPPAAPPGAGAAAPTRDPVTVRGCLEGRWLRILEHDASDLSGVTRVRLKGAAHLANLERPAAFDAAIRTFLRDLDEPA